MRLSFLLGFMMTAIIGALTASLAVDLHSAAKILQDKHDRYRNHIGAIQHIQMRLEHGADDIPARAEFVHRIRDLRTLCDWAAKDYNHYVVTSPARLMREAYDLPPQVSLLDCKL